MKLKEANNTYLGLIAYALILDYPERMLVKREKVLRFQNNMDVPKILNNQFMEPIPGKNAKNWSYPIMLKLYLNLNSKIRLG